MTRVRVKVQPSGCLNGRLWPEEGEELDLPDDVAKTMADAGHVELVKANQKSDKAKTEKRPAPARNVETR